MAALLDDRYRENDKVVVVCDNLNAHTKGASSYQAFDVSGRIQPVKRDRFYSNSES